MAIDDATKLRNAPRHDMDGRSENCNQYRSQKISPSQLVTQLPRDFPRYLPHFPRDSRNSTPAPIKPARF